MLLSKRKLSKIKNTINQTLKKNKRKKKKKRRYRKRARSFRKKKKQLNLKNKSLKNIRKKKYKGGGMESPINFNLFFLTDSTIKLIEITCPIRKFREVIKPVEIIHFLI